VVEDRAVAGEEEGEEMTRAEMDVERLDTALEEVEDSLNYIDCDEAYVLFVEFSVKLQEKVREWQKQCGSRY